jgi:hypothetical protein
MASAAQYLDAAETISSESIARLIREPVITLLNAWI